MHEKGTKFHARHFKDIFMFCLVAASKTWLMCIIHKQWSCYCRGFTKFGFIHTWICHRKSSRAVHSICRPWITTANRNM